MQLYLNAIMDSLVHVIASDKDHANITFQIGNILAESSSGSATSAKTRIFLLTDNIASALLGKLKRCSCDGCQEIYDHIDVVSAQNGRIAAATRFVFLHSANSAPMQAFQKSTIQDVSFAGHHISDCIPSETYSEGSALDTNVHRIIEAHRRMQHTIGLPENFCRTSGGGHSGEWRAVDERPEPGRYSTSGERLGDISKCVTFSICIFTHHL
jgi:hypothetical protein